MKSDDICLSLSYLARCDMIVILSEVSKNETGKDHMIAISYRWNLRYDTDEHVYETEPDSRTQNGLLVAKGAGGGGGKEGCIRSLGLA